MPALIDRHYLESLNLADLGEHLCCLRRARKLWPASRTLTSELRAAKAELKRRTDALPACLLGQGDYQRAIGGAA